MEWLLFCQQFLKDPSTVGSILPSSRFLAQKLVGSVDWRKCNTLVELGAGTGVFTKRLLATKPAEAKMLVFEKDPVFRQMLSRELGDVPLYEDAICLEAILTKKGINQVDCIVSGLPFAMFADRQRRDILRQIHAVLREDGQFITFQYSPQLYRELKQDFSRVQVGFSIMNIPPAIVYNCYK